MKDANIWPIWLRCAAREEDCAVALVESTHAFGAHNSAQCIRGATVGVGTTRTLGLKSVLDREDRVLDCIGCESGEATRDAVLQWRRQHAGHPMTIVTGFDSACSNWAEDRGLSQQSCRKAPSHRSSRARCTRVGLVLHARYIILYMSNSNMASRASTRGVVRRRY
eukprot:SAG11_NODE_179_length_13323_cov_27.934286_3_plen_166_part_00